MRTVAMCLSIFQVPRCRIHTFSNIWKENFHTLSRTSVNSSFRFNLLGSNIHGLEGGPRKKWTRRPVTTKSEALLKKTSLGSKPSIIRNEILDGSVSTGTPVQIYKTEKSQYQKLQYSDFEKKLSEHTELARLLTIIVFDIETTGFSRLYERIIEIAFQDISGGERSTFQTLVNPGRIVPNAHVHGITSHMVNRHDVPRMEDLIPLLVKFIESRQKPGGSILLVAHNARSFDVPFLLNEFSRCSYEIPSNWHFVDTLPLARELMKSSGSSSRSVSLQALREFCGIPLAGTAHRAMLDVKVLSRVLQRLTFDLKLSVGGLMERSFRPCDLNYKKKKN